MPPERRTHSAPQGGEPACAVAAVDAPVKVLEAEGGQTSAHGLVNGASGAPACAAPANFDLTDG